MNECSVHCSNWGNGMLSHYPVMSHVGGFFCLEKGWKRLQLMLTLGSLFDNGKCATELLLFDICVCVCVYSCILCISRQRVNVPKNRRNNYKGC